MRQAIFLYTHPQQKKMHLIFFSLFIFYYSFFITTFVSEYMERKYYNQLVEILLLKPKGLKLSAIAAYLYNVNSGLWVEEGLYERIYWQTKRYLYRESKKRGSIFKSVNGKWGYYAIKPHYARQLRIQFKENH